MVSYSMGQGVEADYQGNGQFLKAKVLGVRDDGTFDLLYDDGNGESGVSAERIRVVGSEGPEHRDHPAAAAASSTTASSGAGSRFAIGSTVEMRTGSARQKNVAWTKCTVQDFDSEMMAYELLLEDGRVEKGVPQGLLRSPGGGKPPGKSGSKKGGRRSRSRLLSQITELTGQFTEPELVAALQMLQAFDKVRASNMAPLQ